MQTDELEIFWQEFLDNLPPESPAHAAAYTAEGFGDSPGMADELGALIADGIKTATCSALGVSFHVRSSRLGSNRRRICPWFVSDFGHVM
jgi:hypothetical protein